MIDDIPERDWKLLRKMKDEKLDRVCKTILTEVEAEIQSGRNKNHKSYLNVWKIK